MRRPRAFVMLSVLLVMLVVGMLLRAAILRMPIVSGSYRHAGDQDTARRAAESGLEYAVTQLRQNPLWRGGGASRTVVNQSGLVVEEERGNVFGRLSDGGRQSQFRLRFNFQDGAGGGDSLTDPSPEHWLKMPWISLNNLMGTSDVLVPLGNGPDGSVPVLSVAHGVVPPQSVSLRVEGLANGQSVVIEGVYRVTANHAVQDAVVMAGGDLQLNVVGKAFLNAAHPRNSADNWVRLRTKKALRVTHPNGSAAELEVAPDRKAQLARDQARGMVAQFDQDAVQVVQEDASDGKDFYSVKWENVHQADSRANTTTAIQIKAGTYVAWPDGSVHYFDMSLREYKQFIAVPANQAEPGTPITQRMSEVRTSTNLELNPGRMAMRPHPLPYYRNDDLHYEDGVLWNMANTDLLVQASDSGTKDFAFVPQFPAAANTTQEMTPVPAGGYTPDNLMLSLINATITAPGQVDLQCCVKGRAGTITSEGNLSIVAGRTLTLKGQRTAVQDLDMVDPELLRSLAQKARLQGGKEKAGLGLDDEDSGTLQLNIYGKGDVNISSFAGRSYRSLGFQGLMYSWGNFRLNAGEDNPQVRRGNVVLNGSLVSYGNDPARQQPGMGADKGGVSVKARNLHLTFDPRFLPSISQLQPDGTALYQLSRTGFRTLPR